MAFKMKENSFGVPMKKSSAMKFFGPRAKARRQARREKMRAEGGDTMTRAEMFLNPAGGIAQSLGFGSNTGIGRFLQGSGGGLLGRLLGGRGGSGGLFGRMGGRGGLFGRKRDGGFGSGFFKNKKY